MKLDIKSHTMLLIKNMLIMKIEKIIIQEYLSFNKSN